MGASSWRTGWHHPGFAGGTGRSSAAADDRAPAFRPRVAMFIKTALLVLKKDIAIELKSLEILSTTLFFAVTCVLIFSFGFVNEGEPLDAVMVPSAILWIAVAFSGMLALGRTFERERYGETLRALLLAPAPRSAIYMGKLLGIVLLLSLTELLLVPMIAFVFR